MPPTGNHLASYTTPSLCEMAEKFEHRFRFGTGLWLSPLAGLFLTAPVAARLGSVLGARAAVASGLADRPGRQLVLLSGVPHTGYPAIAAVLVLAGLGVGIAMIASMDADVLSDADHL
jgi:hypothetical protein